MSEDDAMVDEFFSEVNDKYYPQVIDGLEQLDAGQIDDGIEILARPLHTIKGVTGFMAGFEAASGFTHKVEDFMKKVQSGEVAPEPDNISVLSESVNMIFQVLEQLRDTGAPDDSETDRVLNLIREASEAGGGDGSGLEAAGVEVETKGKDVIVKVLDKRIHFEGQRQPITRAIIEAGPGTPVLLELSEVLTFSSGSWEAIAEFVGIFNISVTGMSPPCKEIYYSWGFDETIPYYPNTDAFLNRKTGE